MCSGPVGLADTNSTSTAARLVGLEPAPASRAAARTPATVDLERRVREPQVHEPRAARPRPRRSARRRDPSRIASASASAMSSGDRRSGRASCIARLVARSPNAGFAGRSMATAGRSTPSSIAGSAPDSDGRVPGPGHGVAHLRPDGGRGGAGLAGAGHGSSPGGRAGSVIVAGRFGAPNPARTRAAGSDPPDDARPWPSSRSSLPGPSGGRCALAPNWRSGSCRLGDNWSVRTSQSGFWQVLSQGRTWYVRLRGASRCAGIDSGSPRPGRDAQA